MKNLITADIWAMRASELHALFSAWQAQVTIPREQASGPPENKIQEGIALIPIVGLLDQDESFMMEIMGGVSYAAIRAQVRAATADPAVKGLMLMVNSPGGTVEGVAETADLIFQAGKVKPVWAQVMGSAASAAYWLASQAGNISANRLDRVGSIGVYGVFYDTSKAAEAQGVKPILVTTGDYKGAGAAGLPITEAQVGEWQRLADAYYREFLAAILRGRGGNGFGPAKIKALADGREWTGQEALSLGLIDNVRTGQETFLALTKEIKRGTPASRQRAASAAIAIASAK